MDELSEAGEVKARALMVQITAIRDEHHACTAREVSRLLLLTHTVAVGRLVALRERGWVDWTDMTGSLRVTEAGQTWLQHGPVVVEAEAATALQTASGTYVGPTQLKRAPKKQAAPKTRNDP